MIKIEITYIIAFISIFYLSGCTTKTVAVQKNINTREKIHTKPYQLKITPIIGSRQDDEKVVINMGKVMKVWITPYKNNGVLVSSHDNYVIAKKQDFVIGEEIPNKNWGSMHTPISRIPFVFRDSELDTSSQLGNKELVKYNNNIYKEENDKNIALKRIKKSSQYDEKIMDFINNN